MARSVDYPGSMRIRTLVATMAACCLAVVSLAFVQDPQPKLLPGPLVTFVGADSKVAERRYVRVTDKEQWAVLWGEHTGQPMPKGDYDWHYNQQHVPEVDFAQCMVVGIFQGDCWNSAGVRLEQILAEDERMLVRFEDKAYQTEGPDGGGKRATPYGLFVLPNSKQPIVLEENVQSLIGEPPKWQLRATL